MKKRVTILSIALLALLVMSVSLFAKEGERDEKIKSQKEKVKTESVTTPTDTKKIDNQTVGTTGSSTTTVSSTDKTDLITTKAAVGETINWQVISSGGGLGTSTSFSLNGTIGQTSTGTGTSSSYILSSGFWQNFATGPVGCCIGLRGNANGDIEDAFDISDVVYMVDWMFNEGDDPPCMDEVDVVIDGSPDISDLVYMVDFMFNEGDPLPPC